MPSATFRATSWKNLVGHPVCHIFENVFRFFWNRASKSNACFVTAVLEQFIDERRKDFHVPRGRLEVVVPVSRFGRHQGHAVVANVQVQTCDCRPIDAQVLRAKDQNESHVIESHVDQSFGKCGSVRSQAQEPAFDEAHASGT